MNVGDLALKAVDLHAVADAKAAFQQHGKAAHVIRRNLLQPKPEPDAKCAAKHREHGEINAHRRQRSQQRQNEETGAQ